VDADVTGTVGVYVNVTVHASVNVIATVCLTYM